jgi:putative ABC transport system ATP-binding protein
MNAIELKSITKKFGNKKVLNNLNLTIKKGETVAIVGKSGKGKSTLLNIIGLIDNSESGSVIIEGTKINNINKKIARESRAKKLEYLFQNFALVDDETIKENLDLALTKSDYTKKQKVKVIAESLKQVGLENREDEKVFNLSGGEQQRVAIARVIARGNDIVLADEPTGALDDVTKSEILEKLEIIKNNKDKTMIIVTHDKQVAAWCDRVLEL